MTLYFDKTVILGTDLQKQILFKYPETFHAIVLWFTVLNHHFSVCYFCFKAIYATDTFFVFLKFGLLIGEKYTFGIVFLLGI